MNHVATGAARAVFVAAFSALTMLSGPAGAATSISVNAGKIDLATAAKVISEYRASHGLPPVKIEPRLTKIASIHAQRMADSDRLDHVLPGEGSFPARMTSGGYDPRIAAEDIGAGYKTLSDVMAAWEKSPEHNANLLQPNVSEIGIAYYTTAAGIYNEYWSLVLAAPMPPPDQTAAGGPAGHGGIVIAPFFFGH